MTITKSDSGVTFTAITLYTTTKEMEYTVFHRRAYVNALLYVIGYTQQFALY